MLFILSLKVLFSALGLLKHFVKQSLQVLDFEVVFQLFNSLVHGLAKLILKLKGH